MKKERNILVLGVGGNVSQGIVTALKLANIPCHIIGACVSHESLGLYFCDSAYISPYANDDSFIPWVIDLCNKEKVDMIFSGVEEVIQVLEKNRKQLEQTTAMFICSPLKCLQIGNNKLQTCQWLKDNGLNYPLFAAANDNSSVSKLIEEVGFPLLAKPIVGKGSAGVMLIHSRTELNLVPKQNYVIQEYLGHSDSEYTVGCYINKSGKLEEMIVCKRSLKYGTTFKAEIVKDKQIEAECAKISSRFGAIGPLNIQLRMHKGIPVCFELNVRFSGTTPLRARWGFNDVLAMINEYMYCVPTNLQPVESGLAYRYFNEAYIDIKMQEKLLKEKVVANCLEYDNCKENK